MPEFKYNMFHELEAPTIILSTKYHKHLGVIENIDIQSINTNFNMASAQELSFDVYKEMDGKTCLLWDSIIDFKYVFVPEFQEYYEITISLDEDNKTVKHITAISACEAELSARRLRNFECNTESDILRDDYEPTVIYNQKNPNSSLLNRVLNDKCPDYTIAHVDTSISSIQRTFSADDTDIYSFLTSTVAEEIECLFVFESINRTISVYDLKNVCRDCGCRNDKNDICLECGSANIKNGYGENTSVYISADNYTELITVEGNTDNVFNCFKIEGGDDLINATVSNINPNGSNYIYSYSQEMLNDMPSELVHKLNSYNELYNKLKPSYEQYTQNIYQNIDEELYLTSKMMPEITTPNTSAEQELSYLISEINEVAVANISVLSNASADIAVKNITKAIIDARYDVNILSSSLSGLTNGTYRMWSGKFEIVNKSNDEDSAASISNTTIKIVGNNYEEYLYQKIQKTISKENALFYSIFEIDDLNTFKDELKKYCLDSLKSFESSYQTCIDILIENGVTDQNAIFYDVNLYKQMYLPYHERIMAIQAELVLRESEIISVQSKRKNYELSRTKIQKQLNFRDYMGEDLWFVLSHYLREDTYLNNNYISDGLDNIELIDKAKELFNVAITEINKASELQYTLTSTLLNLLNTIQFKPFKNKISIGNWINVKADDVLYKLRLISISIDFGNLKNISVTFSNVIKTNGIISDTQYILEQAKSMAGSYDYIAHQAKQGNEANENVQSWITDGLNSALIQIKNNDNEEITYDNHGLWAKSYDDITETYSPEQLRVTSNMLAFTKDNWLTCSAALGKHNYIYYDDVTKSFTDNEDYGLSAQFVQAGNIYGSQIIGGDIYSDNYSSTSGTHLNLRDGSFSFAGGKMFYKNDKLSVNGEITAISGTIGGENGWTIGTNALYNGCSSLSSASAGTYVGIDGIRNYQNSNSNTTISNGKLVTNNADIQGKITATSGNIGGWNINGDVLTSTVQEELHLGDNFSVPGSSTIELNPSSTNTIKIIMSSYSHAGNSIIDETYTTLISGYNIDTTYIKCNTLSSSYLNTAYINAEEFYCKSQQGISQTITIGDKTLVFTGGILTSFTLSEKIEKE